MFQSSIKRCLDVVLSAVLLLLTSPVLVLVAIMVKATSKGPVIFRQMRVGKDGNNFMMFKFRTMVYNAPDIRNADNSTFNSKNDARVTRVGKVLRETSCDELPQLVNVLRGEMSIVGPRPELPEGPASYTQAQCARLKVRPGITGLAAVHGRNGVPVTVRRDRDAHYAENWTLMLDLQILAKTVPLVLQRRGINRESSG
jgi:lipopolysaccharide/colanic/teichoic acid biosynthesis glycosyltransferase